MGIASMKNCSLAATCLLYFTFVPFRAEAASGVAYRCTGEGAAGFAYNGGGWSNMKFTNPQLFEVRIQNRRWGQAYALVDVLRGDVEVDSVKVSDTPDGIWLEIRNGSTAGQLFSLNRRTMKFSYVYTAPFTLDDRSGTPYMVIGACRKVGEDPHPKLE